MAVYFFTKRKRRSNRYDQKNSLDCHGSSDGRGNDLPCSDVAYSPKEFNSKVSDVLHWMDDSMQCGLVIEDSCLVTKITRNGDPLGWVYYLDEDWDNLGMQDKRTDDSVQRIWFWFLPEDGFAAAKVMASVIVVCNPELEGEEVVELCDELLDSIDDKDAIGWNGNYYWSELRSWDNSRGEDVVLISIQLR